jgi:PKD repeat protein
MNILYFKQKATSLLMIMLMTYTGITYGQTIYVGNGTINNGTSSYPSPYGNFWMGARHQFLVLASELTAAGATAGDITNFGFDVVTPCGFPLQNFEIKMATTALTDLTSFQPGAISVYTNATYTDVAGWNMHTLATPFNWDGTSNLIIETCFLNLTYTTNAIFNQTATLYSSSVWFRNDNDATVCTNNTLSSGAPGFVKPNMAFDFACVVNIPDANFKAALVANAAINTNANTEIECSEAAAYTGNIFVQSLNIADLTGIEAFTSLTELHCGQNSLANLDLSSNAALSILWCNNNSLATLNLSANTALTQLSCVSNSLTSLNVSNNTALTTLYCNYNSLLSLDVSTNTALSTLQCHYNSLPSLDLYSNTALIELVCFNNSITSLDLSTNTALEYLLCESNSLTDLNIQNGNNANLIGFDATNNPSLTCIQVDDASYMNNNWSGAKDPGATYTVICPLPCIVNIPNAIFKAALVGNLSINTNADTEIQCSEAASFTGMINVNSTGIADLTGIEAFTVLSELHCGGNQLSNLDVSANTNLGMLTCGNNQLTSLDVSGNTALYVLYCSQNQLTSLDVSNNINLIQLRFYDNLISNIDVSNNILLQGLFTSNNPLNTLDISANSAIYELACGQNQLTTLDVSNNTALAYFQVYNNQLDSLDLSMLNSLNEFNCSGNNLTKLNIQNGNNSNFISFSANSNPNLTCVQVDNPTYMNANWSGGIDAGASFSMNCAGSAPVASFTSNTQNINTGQSINFTDQSINTPTSWFWTFNGGTPSSSTLQNPTNIVYNTPGCYDVSLSVTNGFGSETYSDTCYITVANAVGPVISPGGPITLCAGNSITLTSSIVTGNQWSNGATTQSIVVSSPGMYNVTANGITSNNVVVNVNIPPPSPTITANGPLFFCPIFNVELTSSYSAGNMWNTGATSNSITVDLPGNYTVTYTDSNGCSSVSNTITTGYLNAVTLLNFDAINTQITTSPLSVTFNNTTPYLGQYDFVWYFGDGTMFPSDAPSVDHTYNFNGIYTVSLVAYDISTGCSDTLVKSNYITCNTTNVLTCNHMVTLNPTGVISACVGSVIPLSSTTSLTNANYQWNRNGVVIGGASQNNYYANVNGNYTLTVFDTQGCPVTSSPLQINYSLQSGVPPTITSSGPTNNCGDVNVTLTAVGSFSNYLWSTGQTGNSINVTQGGSYTVTGQSPACDVVSLPTLISGSSATVPPICMVTVDETDNQNVVIWEKPIDASIDSFLVLREDINTPGIYTILSAQAYVELSEFKDGSSDANERAYRYKLAVKDTCGGITIPSTEQRSMHLDVAQGNSILSRQLTWNVYQGQPQVYTHYLIYRETAPGNLNLALIDSVPSSQTWYYDNSLTTITDTAKAYKIGYRVTTPCVSTRAQNDICSSNVTSNENPIIDGINATIDSDFKWSILPNPNDGVFVIRLSKSKKYQLKVVNLIGEEVYQQQINVHTIQIDMSALSNGVYMVTLSDDANVYTQRLVLAH